MAMSAYDEMNLFWKKNQELKRPNSPWWIYRLYWLHHLFFHLGYYQLITCHICMSRSC